MKKAGSRPPMTVTFWGVRGSTSAPDRQFSIFGGHTPCVEIECGDRRLIFDAGSGIQALGKALPGSATVEKFQFTVRDDAVAAEISKVMGKRVTVHYEEKVGLPTSCFGDTRHYVTKVTVASEISLSPGVVVQTEPADAAASAARK